MKRGMLSIALALMASGGRTIETKPEDQLPEFNEVRKRPKHTYRAKSSVRTGVKANQRKSRKGRGR